MREIRNAIPFVKEVIGSQKFQEGTAYRLLTYIIQHDLDDGALLYNVLTRSIVFLTKDEHAHLLEQQQLVASWFLVPVDFDDRRFCQQVKAVGRMLDKPKKGIHGYTILTTTDCNARCFYCYEAGRPRVPMSQTTAHDVARYISTHRGDYEKVSLHWFGGEPLYNYQVIDTICQDLTQADVAYTSKMTSNGYLFTDELIAKATQLWNLNEIQITLDGTEQKYNKVKAYISSDGSAYQRVMSNIKKLIDAGIYVIIRLNIDFHNVDDMERLVEEIAVEVGPTKLLRIYSHLLFNNMGLHPRKRTQEEELQLVERQAILEKQIVKLGYKSRKKSLPTYIKRNQCMADSQTSTVITPKGFLGRCQHYSEDHFYGHILSEEIDENVIKEFLEYQEFLPKCDTCPLYPDCFRLKLCADMPELCAMRKGMGDRTIARIQSQMLDIYEAFCQKETNDKYA